MYSMFLFEALSGVVSLICIMILIAFYILAERKVLGYIQLRKGPNKVGMNGLLQSFSDFFKLIFKIGHNSVYGRGWYCVVSVILLLFMVIIVCVLYTKSFIGSGSTWFLWIIVLGCIISHCILGFSWGSYNKFSVLACVRYVFVSITFEACLMCVVLSFALLNGSYELGSVVSYNSFMVLLIPCVYLVWLISLLGECNRPPFDYGEAESELVSGMNVEYSGLLFICIFVSEYILIYFFSWLSSILFWWFGFYIIGVLLHLIFFIWCRASLPRMRFDCYVNFMWEVNIIVLFISLIICLIV